MDSLRLQSQRLARPNMTKRVARRLDDKNFVALGGMATKKTFHGFKHHLTRRSALNEKFDKRLSQERLHGSPGGRNSAIAQLQRRKQRETVTSKKDRETALRTTGMTDGTALGTMKNGELVLNEHAVATAGLLVDANGNRRTPPPAKNVKASRGAPPRSSGSGMSADPAADALRALGATAQRHGSRGKRFDPQAKTKKNQRARKEHRKKNR